MGFCYYRGNEFCGREDVVLRLLLATALDLPELVVLNHLQDQVGVRVVGDGGVLVLVVGLHGDLQQLLEALLGPLLVAEGVVAEDGVEAGLEVRLFGHDPLEAGAGVRVLAHPHEEDADVVHDLDPHRLVRVGHLVEGHAVELDRLGVLAELEVDVAHVHAKSAGVVEHPVLGNDLRKEDNFV